jgi:hypothetical protein
MSKAIATGAILGSHYYVKQAEALVEKAISEKGADFKFEFPYGVLPAPDVRDDGFRGQDRRRYEDRT